MWIEYRDDYEVLTRARIELTKKKIKHWFSRKVEYEENYYLHVEKFNKETAEWEYYSRRNITNEQLFIIDEDDYHYGFIEDILTEYDDNDFKRWIIDFSNKDTYINFLKEQKKKKLEKRLKERVDITE